VVSSWQIPYTLPLPIEIGKIEGKKENLGKEKGEGRRSGEKKNISITTKGY